MSKKPPIFYPGGEYLDPKWTLVQEFILKITSGDYELELPYDLGEDHIDSVLLALQLMSEDLKVKERQLKAVGAMEGLEQGIIYLNQEGNIQGYNTRALNCVGPTLQRGLHITAVLQQPDFAKKWNAHNHDQMPVDHWTTEVQGALTFNLSVTHMDEETSGGHKGFLLQLVKNDV